MFKVVRNIFLMCLLLPGFSVAAEFEAGTHYHMIPSPMPTRDASKIRGG